VTGCQGVSPVRSGRGSTTTSTTTFSMPSTRCRRISVPPSCSATSKASPTRRSPPPSTSS
jgi:hypothetical protein